MDAASRDDRYRSLLAESGGALLAGLTALERVHRHLHPPEIPGLRDGLRPVGERVEATRAALAEAAVPEGLDSLHEAFQAAVDLAVRAIECFVLPAPPAEAAPRMLESMRLAARAQEALYPLGRVFPPVSDFFFEAPRRGAGVAPEPAADSGFHAAGDPEGRGGFHLYVPETYRDDREWPLVVALHGGFGHGREFLWTWLREARSRDLLLLAPTSRGTTWSFHGPDVDGPALRSMVEFVAERWRVDGRRILLTGLSDGATYSLYTGLREDSPFTALAPVSGVLHPANFANGNLARAAGRRIHLVHGALDWMFPIALAREARDQLVAAGADLVFCEIADLSHAYPREENAHILDWFLEEGGPR